LFDGARCLETCPLHTQGLYIKVLEPEQKISRKTKKTYGKQENIKKKRVAELG